LELNPNMSWPQFKERVSEGYVDWALYLSSYSPLPILLAIRLYGMHDSGAPWLALLFVGMMVPLPHVLSDVRSVTGRTFRITRVGGAAGEVAAYIASYILPLIVIGSPIWTDYIAYGLFIFIVGIVMTRGELLHINPWIYLFGWRLYNVSLGEDDRFYLLSRREPRIGGTVHAKKLRNRLLIEEAS
jgi:hypothetical protein